MGLSLPFLLLLPPRLSSLLPPNIWEVPVFTTGLTVMVLELLAMLLLMLMPLLAPLLLPLLLRIVAYGYQNINSAKQEQGNAYGGVTGSYTYADEAGVHTVNYVADDLGFRVAGDNLPVAPVYNAALPVAPVHLAAPVVDTPEVVEAKAAFFAAFEAEASRTKRSAQLGAFGPTAYAGLATGLLPAGPVAAAAYAAPAAAAPSREAVLTTIKLNPGHAVFYRVDWISPRTSCYMICYPKPVC